MEKRKVIAYLHTHWDREWYREFEVFRLRLLRVFDNVLELLETEKIPSFYFDGQVSALLDYLELRPEKESLVRNLIADEKLFIGPCYTLVDEFLTDKPTFEKNLELGLAIAKDFGCKKFIGYLADTFGHSKNIPSIFKAYGIDKCVVWRGCGDFPSEFLFNGIKTVNLIRGYFMDIFSSPLSIEEKADWLKGNLDKIAEKSSNVLLLPIGADHLGVEADIAAQIEQINSLLQDYEIELSSPFRYFELVKDNFKFKWDDELRDNSRTFILQGSYSARTRIKQLNTISSYKLRLANIFQKKFGDKYRSAIDYAYKLLLKNQAHDGICGCSTDEVHQENITRYKKVLQVADTVLRELKFIYKEDFEGEWLNFNSQFKSVISEKSTVLPENVQVISTQKGFADEILYDTQKIPITEDYCNIYHYIKEISPNSDCIEGNSNKIFNSKTYVEVKNSQVCLPKNITMEFVRSDDLGDTYNFAPNVNSSCEIAKILGSELVEDGVLRKTLKIKTSFFDVLASIEKNSALVKFRIDWQNQFTNKLWQVKFKLNSPIYKAYSEDMNEIIEREFDPYYEIRENLPQTRGIEAKTNTAPMQRYVGTEDVGIVTKGLTEYEVKENSLNVTILRSIGVISNPKNPARSTPAGPPLEVPQAQQLGENSTEFAFGIFSPRHAQNFIEEFFLD